MSKEKARRRRALRAALETAARERSLVRLSGGWTGSRRVEGFVVGIGREWLLLAAFDPRVELDGHLAVRVADVRKVKRRGGPDTFVGRALAVRGAWPPAGADVDLHTTAGLLRTVAEVTPVMSLWPGSGDPRLYYVGRPVHIGKRSVRLVTITPDAEWEHGTGRWPLAEITRVGFGGRYAEALLLVGGPPPA